MELPKLVILGEDLEGELGLHEANPLHAHVGRTEGGCHLQEGTLIFFYYKNFEIYCYLVVLDWQKISKNTRKDSFPVF
jgi:hypothetical protein